MPISPLQIIFQKPQPRARPSMYILYSIGQLLPQRLSAEHTGRKSCTNRCYSSRSGSCKCPLLPRAQECIKYPQTVGKLGYASFRGTHFQYWECPVFWLTRELKCLLPWKVHHLPSQRQPKCLHPTVHLRRFAERPITECRKALCDDLMIHSQDFLRSLVTGKQNIFFFTLMIQLNPIQVSLLIHFMKAMRLCDGMPGSWRFHMNLSRPFPS